MINTLLWFFYYNYRNISKSTTYVLGFFCDILCMYEYKLSGIAKSMVRAIAGAFNALTLSLWMVFCNDLFSESSADAAFKTLAGSFQSFFFNFLSDISCFDFGCLWIMIILCFTQYFYNFTTFFF